MTINKELMWYAHSIHRYTSLNIINILSVIRLCILQWNGCNTANGGPWGVSGPLGLLGWVYREGGPEAGVWCVRSVAGPGSGQVLAVIMKDSVLLNIFITFLALQCNKLITFLVNSDLCRLLVVLDPLNFPGIRWCLTG